MEWHPISGEARELAAKICREAKWTPHVCDEIAEGKHDDYTIVKMCANYLALKAMVELEGA